jgi:cell division protein FtsI/penicillin-binding protein 2
MPRVERRRIDYPIIKKLLGETCEKDGMIAGLSGLEVKFNDKLSGKEGSYIVMLDSKGRWIRGTWTLLKKPEPGSDIVLNKSYEELLKDAKGVK